MKVALIVSLIGSAVAQKGYHAAAPAHHQMANQVSQPIYSCPAGYTLEGKTCTRTESAPSNTVCRIGTLQGDQCVTSVPEQSRCPPGTTPSGGQCISTSAVPPNQFCPPGFTETGKGCSQTTPLPLVEVCDIGVKRGNTCVTTDTAPYDTQSFCPPGYEEHAKGGCWRTEVYDCTPPYAGKNGMRGLAGKQAAAPAPRPTETKVSVIAQTCERKESAPKQTTRNCPPGYTESKNGCKLENHYPTTQRCSNGRAPEDCTTTRTAPYQHECPPGTTPSGGQCTTTHTSPPEHFCPPGTTPSGGVCLNFHPPAEVCPPGYTMTGGICTRRDTAPPQVTVTVTCTGKGCYNH